MIRRREGTLTALPFIHTVKKLSNHLLLDKKTIEEIEEVSVSHPFRIPKYYLDLMEKDNPLCSIRKQSVPSREELTGNGDPDPLNEKNISLTPSFFKRYQNRGVFLASSDCAMYCRFCNRRRLIGKKWDARLYWEDTFQYLEKDREIHEVIVSGGDPFMLSADELDYVLSRLRCIRRIKTIRISTRMPVVYPEGLQQGHFDALKKSSPLWIVIHINHPREVSKYFIETVNRLRDAGNIIISQTVLLRGVNDCPHILAGLFESLVYCGVKPYYLFQLDEVRGAGHFKVKLKKGIEIMRFLRANVSGLAMPQYALDITGGLGKVALDYKYVRKRKGNKILVEGLSGKTGIYNDDAGQSSCSGCNICKHSLLL
jgi:lysine 2,3-aminomutase